MTLKTTTQTNNNRMGKQYGAFDSGALWILYEQIIR